MSEAKPFRGGLPYAPDVKRLTEAFPAPELTEERVIQHEELEVIAKANKGAQRYYSVVNAWMMHQRNENGIFMVWVPSVGIKVLPPEEVMLFAENRVRQKSKQTRRAVKLFRWVDGDRLDEVGRKRLDHQMLVGARIDQELARDYREMAIDLAPVASLPKPKLIKKSN